MADQEVQTKLKAVDDSRSAFNSYNKNLKSVQSNTKKTSSSLGVMNHSAGQLSLQLQDVAVQLQSGTRHATILAQQGPQIASAFGPGGAAAGAIIAFGALALTMGEDLLVAKDASITLTQAIDSIKERAEISSDGVLTLTRRIHDLSKVSIEAAKVEIGIGIVESQVAIESAKQKIVDDLQEITNAYDALDRAGNGRQRRAAVLRIKRIREELGLSGDQMREFARLSKIAVQEPTTESVSALNNFALSVGLGDKEFRGLISTINTSLASMSQMDQMLDALQKGFNDVQGALNNYQTTVESDPFFTGELDPFNINEAFDTKGYIQSLNEIAEAERNVERANQSLATSATQTFSTLASLGKEGTDTQKAFFAISQGIAAADAIIKGFQAGAATRLAYAQLAAASQNPALEAIGVAKGKIQVALGFATAGAIAGQAAASFEGGGFTGAGPRIGGIDGKGGKLSILHPNEKVTDLTRSNGSAGVIIHNYSGQPVKQMTRGEVIEIAIGVVNSETPRMLANQNSQARMALHQTSNVQPRGNR